MSLASEETPFRILCELERLLNEFANKCTGELSPYRMMEVLKEDCSVNGLTHLGKLVRACLSNSEDFNAIRWITFHFDLPSPIAGQNETETRNWIALRHREQDLLDAVHKQTIERGKDYISQFYAPSILMEKFSAKKCPHLEEFREKWWLYNLDPIPAQLYGDQNPACASLHNDDEALEKIVCFTCVDTERVMVCTCPSSEMEDSNAFSLGMLLDETEAETTRRFLGFAKLVQHRSSMEFPHLHNNVILHCNGYMRIPVFFYFDPEMYMTELFLAMNIDYGQTDSALKIIRDVVPALRICVSLINSQIAYSIGHHAKVQAEVQTNVQNRLDEQRHTIKNKLPIPYLESAENGLLRNKEKSEVHKDIVNAIRISKVREIAYMIACGGDLPEFFNPGCVWELLEWIHNNQESDASVATLVKTTDLQAPLDQEDTKGAAFTVLWNLWNNAEKVSRHHGRSFKVEYKSTGCDSSVFVVFENGGDMEDPRWKEFLLGGRCPNESRRRTGLQIVMSEIVKLGWKIEDVDTGNGNTTVMLRIPTNRLIGGGDNE